MASVARSGRPIFVTTCRTSGKRATIASSRVEMSADSSIETEGSLRVSMRIAPSSRRGMNSVPSHGTEPMAMTMADVAIASVRGACRRAACRNRRYRVRSASNQRASSWCPPVRSSRFDATGTPVSESTSAPNNAEHTVMAIGRNILPSRPSSANSGR